jgi:Outer membrane protein beta-barrel domain
MTLTVCKPIALSLILTVIAWSTQAQDNTPAPPSDNKTEQFKLDIHYGIKAGANVFHVNGANFNSSFLPGFDAGVFAEIFFIPELGVTPELLFNQTNFKTGNNFGNIYPDGANNYKGTMNYVTLPFLITYRPSKWFSLQAGPQYGVLLNNNKAVLNGKQTAFKNGNASLVIGPQFHFGKLRVGGRYVFGLTDLNGMNHENSTFDLSEWSNQGFQFYLGYRIF